MSSSEVPSSDVPSSDVPSSEVPVLEDLSLETPKILSSKINLQKLDYVAFETGYTDRIAKEVCRGNIEEIFSSWDRKDGKEVDDETLLQGLIDRGALYISDNIIDPNSLNDVSEIQFIKFNKFLTEDEKDNILEIDSLIEKRNSRGYILFKCSNIAEAFTIHRGLGSINYCVRLEDIYDIEGHSLENGKSLAIFCYDTESG